MSINITINGITFFLIRLVDNLHPRYKEVLEIHSHEDGRLPFSFWVYRSNSELGFWRLCISKETDLRNLILYKGETNTDYVQATFIHLQLQQFINENISLISKVTLDDDAKIEECICYVNVARCRHLNDKATREIIDWKRIITRFPFAKLQMYDIRMVKPIGCGKIGDGVTDEDVRKLLVDFSDNLEDLYDIEDVTFITTFSFNFDNIMNSDGEIYCIKLTAKDNNPLSDVNTVLIYFLKTKLNIHAKLLPNIHMISSEYRNNITRICGEDVHVFPFLITNDKATITPYGLYSKYIPSGIFVCKLFDYHGYDQCTEEERKFQKCNAMYSYIGKRYYDLFPLREAVDSIASTCIVPSAPPMRSLSPRRSSSQSSTPKIISDLSLDSSRDSYETTSISHFPIRQPVKMYNYKKFKKHLKKSKKKKIFYRKIKTIKKNK
jgi:hypothetical protein